MSKRIPIEYYHNIIRDIEDIINKRLSSMKEKYRKIIIKDIETAFRKKKDISLAIQNIINDRLKHIKEEFRYILISDILNVIPIKGERTTYYDEIKNIINTKLSGIKEQYRNILLNDIEHAILENNNIKESIQNIIHNRLKNLKESYRYIIINDIFNIIFQKKLLDNELPFYRPKTVIP